MSMATNCHSSAVLLCLQGNMAHGAGTMGAKRFDPTSCSLGTKNGGVGGAVSSGIGQTTHRHLFPRLRMCGFYLHFHMHLFGTVLN